MLGSWTAASITVMMAQCGQTQPKTNICFWKIHSWPAGKQGRDDAWRQRSTYWQNPIPTSFSHYMQLDNILESWICSHPCSYECCHKHLSFTHWSLWPVSSPLKLGLGCKRVPLSIQTYNSVHGKATCGTFLEDSHALSKCSVKKM